MKSLGIVRKIDELGRITLPKELEQTIGTGPKVAMEIFVEGEAIILKRYQPGCTFCHGMDELKPFGGQQICGKCIAALAKG